MDLNLIEVLPFSIANSQGRVQIDFQKKKMLLGVLCCDCNFVRSRECLIYLLHFGGEYLKYCGVFQFVILYQWDFQSFSYIRHIYKFNAQPFYDNEKFRFKIFISLCLSLVNIIQLMVDLHETQLLKVQILYN